MADALPQQRVDIDAGTVFARPRRIVLALTFVAGVLDAVGYGQFGVFTANQAGNLVVGWTLLPSRPGVALLSLASLVGCALGVGVVVAFRRRWPWLAGPPGSRALLLVAAVLVLVAALIALGLNGPDPVFPNVTSPLGSSRWWAEAASVSVSALSVAILATVFVSGDGMRASILASTNAYVDAVRYGAASALDRTDRHWGRLSWRAAGFPLAWTLGAASTVLLPFSNVAVVGCAATVIVAVAMFSRRVNDPSDGHHRTV